MVNEQMSLVGNTIAPAVLIGSSAIGLYQQRGLLRHSRAKAFLKGSASLAACVVLQLAFIRRCAMGGKSSNLKGVLSMIYPPVLLSLMVVTFMLFRDIPPSMLLYIMSGPSRLGASGNHPVYQYRLNDVIDRVREIVGDRVNQGADDFRER